MRAGSQLGPGYQHHAQPKWVLTNWAFVCPPLSLPSTLRGHMWVLFTLWATWVLWQTAAVLRTSEGSVRAVTGGDRRLLALLPTLLMLTELSEAERRSPVRRKAWVRDDSNLSQRASWSRYGGKVSSKIKRSGRIYVGEGTTLFLLLNAFPRIWPHLFPY